MYAITGQGGLYPEGCRFVTMTANGAIERYRAVRIACGRAVVRDHVGFQVSAVRLARLAERELTSDL